MTPPSSSAGALNLNVHFHALILDGVFAPDADGALAFRPSPRLTTLDVEEVLATIEPLVRRRLRRHGLGAESDDGGALDRWADEAPLLAGLAATSVQGLIAAMGRASRGTPLSRACQRLQPPRGAGGAGGPA